MADSFASAIGWLHGEIHLAPLRLNLKSLKMSTPVFGFLVLQKFNHCEEHLQLNKW